MGLTSNSLVSIIVNDGASITSARNGTKRRPPLFLQWWVELLKHCGVVPGCHLYYTVLRSQELGFILKKHDNDHVALLLPYLWRFVPDASGAIALRLAGRNAIPSRAG